MSRFIIFSLLLTAFSSSALATNDELANYCKKNHGVVENMTVSVVAATGARVSGFTKPFCNFEIDNGLVSLGLITFSSKKPNIAASLITQLPPIGESSPLFEGPYSNPSFNVCKNLGGSQMGFTAVAGNFSDPKGESDICVFGDGSMVSAWSLIYIANGRDGYDAVKNAIRSEPVKLAIPFS